MVINYCGENCFKIQSGKLSVIIDPVPRFKGDIVLKTAISHLPPLATGNEIAGPGEYEMQGVEITGWSAGDKKNQTVYLVKMEGINLCFLGTASENLAPNLLEKLGEVDILFVSTAVNSKTIKQIQSKIIIPSYEKPDALKTFLKNLEQKPSPQEKLTIKKKGLPDKTKVYVLTS